MCTLRSNLSIIPQSPMMFQGSLRAYMSLFDEFTGVEIWSALEKVGMKTQVSALEGQLVYENGENFSVGKQQLLYMRSRAADPELPLTRRRRSCRR
ncbi:ATP-binding Cassette (ABC) Superfamily [Phytophthora cinnamomi]|uniref:ATP-binding Cassette (ABC) Superfamily n=1 Tax=Phytophthora cinnamomi TaxID=4785 RepID=UPI003559C08A|nr:ATP-binding Cassette (ABC) Superfamily [Phytophthora cinnamomi]